MAISSEFCLLFLKGGVEVGKKKNTRFKYMHDGKQKKVGAQRGTIISVLKILILSPKPGWSKLEFH